MGYNGIFIFSMCWAVALGNKRLVLHSDQDVLARFTAMENHISQLETRLKNVEQENNILRSTQGGSTYIRWGKTSCPENGTSLVYKGYAAGNHFTNSGGGVNTLCLPDDPTWSKYSTNEKYPSYIYGTELDSTDSLPLLGYNYKSQDIPCALCEVDRPRTVMIPGRANCYPGWTQEYTGYLMSGYHSQASNTDFICLHESPNAIAHGGAVDHEHLLYFVEATCSSLSCPPYVNGREMACVVCSK